MLSSLAGLITAAWFWLAYPWRRLPPRLSPLFCCPSHWGVPKYAHISVICVTHCIGFPFSVASFTEYLHWSRSVSLALLQFTCSNSRLVSTLVGRRALHSPSGGKLLVPRANTSTMQRRALWVVAPFIWTSLPLQIRLLSKSNTPLLYKLLKTDLYHRGWTGIAPQVGCRGHYINFSNELNETAVTWNRIAKIRKGFVEQIGLHHWIRPLNNHKMTITGILGKGAVHNEHVLILKISCVSWKTCKHMK